MEASGFGVMHVDENDRIIDFLEKPADPPAMPGKPDTALASMGIYVFDTQVPDRATAAATPPIRIRATISARTSFPTSSSTARRWRITSADPASAPATIRAAYWRDVGTVDAYWAANIDLTDIVPELDLYDRDWPIWTYAEITPPAKFVHDVDGRRGAGGHPRWCRAAASSRAPSCAARCCSPACACTPTRGSRGGDPALRRCRPRRAADATWSSTAACNIPEGLVVGEDPELDAQRFRRTDKGICLITQPMIDQAGGMSLSGSFRSRRKSTRWSRPAAWPMWPARCRSRWRRTASQIAHADAGLSRGAATRCSGAERLRIDLPDLFGGPAQLLGGTQRGLDCSCWMRRISSAAPGNPYRRRRWARTGLTTACASPPWAGVAADIGLGAIPRLAPDIVHAHDWQAGLAPAYLHYTRPAAAGHGA